MPWLTYAQAGGRLGVSAEAVRAVAKRRRWPRRRSNTDPHGAVEVEVPDDARITPKPAARPVTDRSPPGRLDLAAGALAALETAVMSLTARAERAEAASLATEARALAAEVALTGERTRSDDLRTRLDALTARLAEAQAAAEALRAAEVERQGRIASGSLGLPGTAGLGGGNLTG